MVDARTRELTGRERREVDLLNVPFQCSGAEILACNDEVVVECEAEQVTGEKMSFTDEVGVPAEVW